MTLRQQRVSWSNEKNVVKDYFAPKDTPADHSEGGREVDTVRPLVRVNAVKNWKTLVGVWLKEDCQQPDVERIEDELVLFQWWQLLLHQLKVFWCWNAIKVISQNPAPSEHHL